MKLLMTVLQGPSRAPLRAHKPPQVLASLHSSGLSDTQLALLRPLHQRGAQRTRKQQQQDAERRKQASAQGGEAAWAEGLQLGWEWGQGMLGGVGSRG